MPGFLTNSLPLLSQVSASMRVPVDTVFPRGSNPASVAATALQIAGVLMDSFANQATSTAGAAAINHFGGIIATEVLATPPGGTYTFTLLNTVITAAYIAQGSVPVAEIYSATNIGGNTPPDMFANMQLLSATPTVGQCVFVWRNNGATALNGTMQIVFHL